MTHNKTRLQRLLVLETCLAIFGITISSCFFLYTLWQQQQITEKLFTHPFAVSNAGVEFRSNVLELRKFMLETILLRKQFGHSELATISRFEDHMDRHLAIIRKDFLGDQARVTDIMREIDTWKKIREPIKTYLLAGNTDKALDIAMQQASPHIEQTLNGIDYVISFARSRALRFVEEGRARQDQARLMLVLLTLLSLTFYMILSYKLRHEIHRIYDMEEHNATFDDLSGSHNRRTFLELGELEIQRSLRHGQPLSLLMMDLDHFKNVNDMYGHDAGDYVLRQLGVLCSQHLRINDTFGRLGGEEFAILLPHTDLNGAMHIAERIRQGIADKDFNVTDGKGLKVTISIGVATLDRSEATMEKLLKHADNALYRSKHDGRNRVTPWSREIAAGNDPIQ